MLEAGGSEAVEEEDAKAAVYEKQLRMSYEAQILELEDKMRKLEERSLDSGCFSGRHSWKARARAPVCMKKEREAMGIPSKHRREKQKHGAIFRHNDRLHFWGRSLIRNC